MPQGRRSGDRIRARNVTLSAWPTTGLHDSIEERVVHALCIRFDRVGPRKAVSIGHSRSSRIPQVIPEGAGPVKSCGRPFSCPRPGSWTRRARGRGQGSGGARPWERPEGLDAGPVRRTMFVCVGVWVSGCWPCPGSRGLDGFSHHRPLPVVGSRLAAARSSLRGRRGEQAATGRMMGFAEDVESVATVGRGQSDGATTPVRSR